MYLLNASSIGNFEVKSGEGRGGEGMLEVTSTEDKTIQGHPHPHGKHTSYTHLLSLLLYLSSDWEMINSRELKI